MDADQLVRVLGLSESFSGDYALARKAAASNVALELGAAGQTLAKELDATDHGNPGRGLAIGLGLSAILWSVLLSVVYALMR